MKAFSKNVQSGRWTITVTESEAIVSREARPDHIQFTPENSKNGKFAECAYRYWLYIR